MISTWCSIGFLVSQKNTCHLCSKISSHTRACFCSSVWACVHVCACACVFACLPRCVHFDTVKGCLLTFWLSPTDTNPAFLDCAKMNVRSIPDLPAVDPRATCGLVDPGWTPGSTYSGTKPGGEKIAKVWKVDPRLTIRSRS